MRVRCCIISSMARTARHHTSMNHGVSKKTFTLSMLAALVVVIGVGAGTWYWQQRNIQQLQNDVSRLNTRIATLQDTDQSGSERDRRDAPSETSQPDYTYTSQKGVEIEVYKPLRDTRLFSPVEVVGRIPGTWSFEGDFPLEVRDGSGNVVAQTPAQIHGDGMTEEMVVFTAELTITGNPSGEGVLFLRKANPSGQADNNDSLSIPVTF